jgi:hypothetical protein
MSSQQLDGEGGVILPSALGLVDLLASSGMLNGARSHHAHHPLTYLRTYAPDSSLLVQRPPYSRLAAPPCPEVLTAMQEANDPDLAAMNLA